MPIVSRPVAELSHRDEVLFSIDLLIDNAVSSADEIDTWKLASAILEAFEERVNSVDPEGTVIYRT